jgi:NADPH:quinone reductase-like Zn-dependent oxidoreductase
LHGVRAAYFYVDVTVARLNELTKLFDSSKLTTAVGTVVSLDDVRAAHEMLACAPHKRGKIVLRIGG